MKDLKTFINESIQVNESNEKLFDELFGVWELDTIPDEVDDDEREDAEDFIYNVKELIYKFLNDNKITSVDQVKIESSEDAIDYTKEMYDDIEVSDDPILVRDAAKGFMGFGDAWLPEYSSWRYDKSYKVLYASSQCGSYMNGDYFDFKFSKK